MNQKLIKLYIFVIILTFCFSSIGSLYAKDNNAETKGVSKSIVSPQQPPLNVELLEYKLSEKVENRVISSIKMFGILLGIVIAVATFFGASLILDYLSRRVEKQVNDRLADDLSMYRKRLQENLVELEMSVIKQKELSEHVKAEFENFKKSNIDLKNIQKQYSNLYDEVSEIREKVKKATEKTAQLSANTEQLRDAVTESAAGKPAIFGGEFSWEKGNGGHLSGTNFGSSIGQLYIKLGFSVQDDKAKGVFSEPFLIDHENIVSWTDTKIVFKSFPELQSLIKLTLAELEKKIPEGAAWDFKYIVEPTANS